jgi:hypothetical protein
MFQPMKFAPKHEAEDTVKKYLPIIRQCIKGQEDLICRIGAGPTDPIDFEPELYYWVRKRETGGLYLGIMVYHYYDSASRHNNDTESIIYCPSSGEMATVCHLNFKWKQWSSLATPFVAIESGGHGISPDLGNTESENFVEYTKFKLVNLASITEKQWYDWRRAFSPTAKLPDEQYDRTLENWVEQRHVEIEGEWVRSTKGMLWARPDMLFELASRFGRL